MRKKVKRRKAEAKRSGPALDPDRLRWMKQYGLNAHQLDSKVFERLKKCTELGREIMLIVMRLEMQPFTANVRANIAKLGREKLEVRRSRRAAARELKACRERQVRKECVRFERLDEEMRRALIVYGDWSDEPGPRVSRMVDLARRVA